MPYMSIIASLTTSSVPDVYAICPRTAPGTAREECASAKKPAGFASICDTWKAAPVSTPSAKMPVAKGPLIQPMLLA